MLTGIPSWRAYSARIVAWKVSAAGQLKVSHVTPYTSAFIKHLTMPRNKKQNKKVKKTKNHRAKARPSTNNHSNLGANVGRAIGTAFGPAGGAVGGFLGGAAHKLFKSITGVGDYEVMAQSLPYDVNANTILHPRLAPTVPLMHNDDGSCRVKHREYIKDIVGAADGKYSRERFVLNPGDAVTFPWLSAIATRWQQYKIIGAVFEFVSTSGEAITGTNPALGSVTMATQYNVLDGNFINKRQACNSYFATNDKPSNSQMHAIECEDIQTPYKLYYVRNPAVTQGVGDPRLYDLGRLEVLCTGQLASGNVIGELWITYDVMLYKPYMGDIQGYTFVHTYDQPDTDVSIKEVEECPI